MKWLDIRRTGILIAVMLCSIASLAQDATDTLKIAVKDYRTGWSKLIPHYAKLQYAGSMGFMSIGGGYDYGVNKQWETDVFVGFLPHYSTSKNKITLTVKQNYIPWKIHLSERFMFEPATTGLYVNTIFDDEFWISEPDKYPNGYYSFSTRIRFNAFIGQRITYNFKAGKDKTCKSATFFYEVSTNDVYVLSAFNNSYLKPKDYLVLSLGLKFQIL